MQELASAAQAAIESPLRAGLGIGIYLRSHCCWLRRIWIRRTTGSIGVDIYRVRLSILPDAGAVGVYAEGSPELSVGQHRRTVGRIRTAQSGGCLPKSRHCSSGGRIGVPRQRRLRIQAGVRRRAVRAAAVRIEFVLMNAPVVAGDAAAAAASTACGKASAGPAALANNLDGPEISRRIGHFGLLVPDNSRLSEAATQITVR